MLELKNISKKFENFAISNLNVTINTGDYFVLLGVSGAGKSLLLELISGLIKVDSGSIFLEEKDITHEKIQKRQIGIVFQDFAIFPHLTVKENIGYPLKRKKINSKEIQGTVLRLAEEMSISHLLNRKPSTLSGGELQRVALARTLALNPKCLLLDEPLTSLDVQLRDELRSLLRKINNSGQTIIHVTHDYEETISLATKIAIINEGRIIQEGTPRDVFQHPKSEFVANLTGVKNFFKVEIKIKENSKVAVINDSLDIYLLTDDDYCTGYIIIRNEDIILSNNKLESSIINNFEGEVIDIVPAKLGVEILVYIGIKLAVLITEKSLQNLKLEKGIKVWISFKASAVRFIRN